MTQSDMAAERECDYAPDAFRRDDADDADDDGSSL